MAGMQPEQKQMILGTEEAIARLIQQIMEISEPKVMTDLNDEETGFMSLLSTVGEQMKINAVKEFCRNFSLYRVSRYRQGRRELVDIAGFAGAGQQDQRKKIKSVKDLFGGIR